jgi:thioredoxin-like negative regulator of GroEL
MKRRNCREVRFILFTLIWLGILSFFAMDNCSAIQDVTGDGKAQGMNMESIAPQFEKALHLAEAENWRQAESILQDLHAVYPHNREIANNLAVVYFYQGRIDKALELLATILTEDPQTRTLILNLQKLYGYSAAEAYRQGLGLNEKTSMPRLHLSHDLEPTFPAD